MDSIRQEIPQRYNNDEGAAGVYNIEQQAIMGYGIPPPEFLRECCALFEHATAQRMVS